MLASCIGDKIVSVSIEAARPDMPGNVGAIDWAMGTAQSDGRSGVGHALLPALLWTQHSNTVCNSIIESRSRSREALTMLPSLRAAGAYNTCPVMRFAIHALTHSHPCAIVGVPDIGTFQPDYLISPWHCLHLPPVSKVGCNGDGWEAILKMGGEVGACGCNAPAPALAHQSTPIQCKLGLGACVRYVHLLDGRMSTCLAIAATMGVLRP